MENDGRLPSSFRDPSGFLFTREGNIYRAVAPAFLPTYRSLIESGLYDDLTEKKWLVRHREVKPDSVDMTDAGAILEPDRIPFISYPYEWTFSQWRDAAIRTAEIQETSLAHGMSLRDASAFNIQFHDGAPLLIDSLSFEDYREGTPWVAYRQFCRHFLGPLAVMAYRGPDLGLLFRSMIDGIPLRTVSNLLPLSTWARPGLLVHLHLHARAAARPGAEKKRSSRSRFSSRAMAGLIDSLMGAVRRLNLKEGSGQWSVYYDACHYDETHFEQKRRTVRRWIEEARPGVVWDLGCNEGRFSMEASETGARVIAIDSDHSTVDRLYRRTREEGIQRILPLVMDLTNPSPALGWDHRERSSLAERGPAEMVLALALLHHLCIGNNLPIGHVAKWFSRIGNRLIIEFVPKSDPQVTEMLALREDIFSDYTKEEFMRRFSDHFETIDTIPLGESGRILYLMDARRK